MTKDEIKEIYEAIAVALQALEGDGEDLRTDDDEDNEYAIIGRNFRIVYNGRAEQWEVRE